MITIYTDVYNVGSICIALSNSECGPRGRDYGAREDIQINNIFIYRIWYRILFAARDLGKKAGSITVYIYVCSINIIIIIVLKREIFGAITKIFMICRGTYIIIINDIIVCKYINRTVTGIVDSGRGDRTRRPRVNKM